MAFEKRCSTQQPYLGQGFFNVFQMQPRLPYAGQVGGREGIHRVLANELLDLKAKSDKTQQRNTTQTLNPTLSKVSADKVPASYRMDMKNVRTRSR